MTNRAIDAEKLLPWYYKRCGHSEEAHAVLKNELAGGVLPCGNFHANSIWWWIAVISHNIHSLFKRLRCDETCQRARLKHIRFHIINIAGRIVERGRKQRRGGFWNTFLVDVHTYIEYLFHRSVLLDCGSVPFYA
ncbi:MAG: transposase [Deltaproteobacteria bacterium]|nr:transposase [Deltaproteobacteria bacterium]